MFITLTCGWKTIGECEAKTNLVKTSASIFKFDVDELSCQHQRRRDESPGTNEKSTFKKKLKKHLLVMPSLSQELEIQFDQPSCLARQQRVLSTQKRHQPAKIRNMIKKSLIQKGGGGHTHIYVYEYVHACVCVCVCIT